jgi:spore coat protein CotH
MKSNYLKFWLTFLLVVASSQPILSAQEKKLSANKLFDPNQIVDIKIEVPQKDWDTIRRQSRSFAESLTKKTAASPFTYVKCDITIDGVTIKDVGIRKKGFIGSLDENRPSLKIKFDHYQGQTPVDGLDRLTLNNNKQDPSRINQYLAYKLFNESGTAAPRCNFAKVTVNGKPLGIYSNVESVKEPFLKNRFADGTGGLFEGTVTDFFDDFVRKFEKKNQSADYKSIAQITEILAQEQVDLAALNKLVDIDAFVKFWAMESLIGFWDGYCNNQNNFFIYQKPANGKYYFIPWGIDSAFTKTMPLPPYRVRPRSVHSQSILANRLYRIAKIRKQYEQTLMDFLEKHWDEEKLAAELDRVESMLKDDILEQNRRFERDVRRIRSFVKTRRKEILKEFADGPPELKTRERRPSYFAPIGKATISFSTKWYDKTPRKVMELGKIEIDLELDGQPVEFEQVGVYAEPSKIPVPGGKQPPAIVIVGKRKSDGKRLTLGTGTSIEQFRPGKKPVPVGGLFFEGFRFGANGEFQMIGGDVVLDAAEMKNGSPVSGKMKVNIVKMQGGKPVDESK